jgi:hypothetical protein
MADARRFAGGADHRHLLRTEERAERSHGRDPVPRLQAGQGGFRGHDRQVHLDLAALGPFLEREARLLEDLVHRLVVGVGDRPEVREAVPHGQQRQPLQEERAQALALEGVVHSQCDLGGPLALGLVTPRGDDARFAALRAGDDQTHPRLRIGAPAQGGNLFRTRRRGGEESPPPRPRGKTAEEIQQRVQRVPILRPGDANLGGCAVTQREKVAVYALPANREVWHGGRGLHRSCPEKHL